MPDHCAGCGLPLRENDAVCQACLTHVAAGAEPGAASAPTALPLLPSPRPSRLQEHLGVLAIEEARTMQERRLLLAGEFMRLAGEVLTAEPEQRATWPADARITELMNQADTVLASATDPTITFLPGSEPNDPLTAEAVTIPIQTLTNYLRLLQSCQGQNIVFPEALRVLARERTRLRIEANNLTTLVQRSP